MKIRLHPGAEADLRSIHRRIAERDPRRANSFIGELHGKIVGLGRMAESFPVLEAYAKSGLRRRTHGNYRIFYRILAQQDAIEVTHVMHMSRDHTPLLTAWERG